MVAVVLVKDNRWRVFFKRSWNVYIRECKSNYVNQLVVTINVAC